MRGYKIQVKIDNSAYCNDWIDSCDAIIYSDWEEAIAQATLFREICIQGGYSDQHYRVIEVTIQ